MTSSTAITTACRPQRAIISENVGRVTLATGAGDLGTASTSNLGGTIDTFSSDPRDRLGVTLQQTVGSYDALRSYVRIDSGDLGRRQPAPTSRASGRRRRAWDFQGKQGGYQADGKIVHDGDHGKLTLFVAFSDKTEPNEDATIVSATQVYQPYTRPFLYPRVSDAIAYYNNQLAYNGVATYTAAASNYRNYYSTHSAPTISATPNTTGTSRVV